MRSSAIVSGPFKKWEDFSKYKQSLTHEQLTYRLTKFPEWIAEENSLGEELFDLLVKRNGRTLNGVMVLDSTEEYDKPVWKFRSSHNIYADSHAEIIDLQFHTQPLATGFVEVFREIFSSIKLAKLKHIKSRNIFVLDQLGSDKVFAKFGGVKEIHESKIVLKVPFYRLKNFASGSMRRSPADSHGRNAILAELEYAKKGKKQPQRCDENQTAIDFLVELEPLLDVLNTFGLGGEGPNIMHAKVCVFRQDDQLEITKYVLTPTGSERFKHVDWDEKRFILREDF